MLQRLWKSYLWISFHTITTEGAPSSIKKTEFAAGYTKPSIVGIVAMMVTVNLKACLNMTEENTGFFPKNKNVWNPKKYTVCCN